MKALLRRERGVEGGGRWFVTRESAHELECLGCADETIHARILPLDRERSFVPDRVQHAERVLPRHVAVSGRDEVPPPARVSPREVRRQTAVATVVQSPLRVLA